MSQRLKRVNSNIDSEVQSLVISGNLHEVPTSVESLDLDDDEDFISLECSEEDSDKGKRLISDAPSKLEDYQKANKICDELYGVNLLDFVTKLLISEELDAKDFVMQALAYKVQSLTRGSSGIR